jgi:hypothetical protein
MQCTIKSKAQLEPRLTLSVSSDELTQNPLIPGQFTFKHIHQSSEFHPKFLLQKITELSQKSKLK